MLPLSSDLTGVYRLTGVLAGLLVVSSVLGIAFGPSSLYTAYAAALAGLVGQDIMTIVVGLPLLVGSAWLARRGSVFALLAWAGAFFYFAYSYYFFVVGGFNALFLVYVAIVATGLYGLLSLVRAIDAEAVVRRIGSGLPRRRVSVFFGVIVGLFALLWGGMSVGLAMSGEPAGWDLCLCRRPDRPGHVTVDRARPRALEVVGVAVRRARL
jgi:hypothetical protein